MLLTLAGCKTLLGIEGTDEDARLRGLLARAEAVVRSYTGRDFARKVYREYYSGTGTRHVVLRQRPVKEVYEVRLDFEGLYGQTAYVAGSAVGFDSATSLLAEGRDYVLQLDDGPAAWSRCGLLSRVNYAWPEVPRVSVLGKLSGEPGPALGNVYVEYLAGYLPYDQAAEDAEEAAGPETLPGDVTQAVAALVAYWRRHLAEGGQVVRERLGRWEVELSDPSMVREGGRPRFYPGLPPEVFTLLAPYKEVVI